MADSQQVIQLWHVSPNGGKPRQVTRLPSSIQSAFSWRPCGEAIAFICDNSVMLCRMATGECQRLTVRHSETPSGEAVVWSPDGKQIAFMREKEGWRQLFTVAVA